MDMGGAMAVFGIAMMAVMVGFLAWAAVAALRGRAGKRGTGSDARSVLDERFARGELDADDYARRRRMLDRSGT